MYLYKHWYGLAAHQHLGQHSSEKGYALLRGRVLHFSSDNGEWKQLLPLGGQPRAATQRSMINIPSSILLGILQPRLSLSHQASNLCFRDTCPMLGLLRHRLCCRQVAKKIHDLSHDLIGRLLLVLHS